MTLERLDEAVVFLRLVGHRVAQARVIAGMTHAELATRASLGADAIAGLERGEAEIDVDQLHRVAAVLGLRTADLVPDMATVRRCSASGG